MFIDDPADLIAPVESVWPEYIENGDSCCERLRRASFNGGWREITASFPIIRSIGRLILAKSMTTGRRVPSSRCYRADSAGNLSTEALPQALPFPLVLSPFASRKLTQPDLHARLSRG
jgi:hypothetical protein